VIAVHSARRASHTPEAGRAKVMSTHKAAETLKGRCGNTDPSAAVR